MAQSFEEPVNFDNDYYKALSTSLDIAKEFTFGVRKRIENHSSTDNQVSESFGLADENSNSCNAPLSAPCENELKKDIKKYNTASEVLYAIDMMYSLCNEKVQTLKERNKRNQEMLIDDNEDILTLEALNQKLERIQNTVHHLTRIKENHHKLKKLLRDSNAQDVWKIHVDCQKFVVEFFEISNKLIRDLEEDIKCAKWSCNIDSQYSDIESVLHDFQDHVAKLHANVGAISDYLTALKNAPALQ